MRHMKFNDSAVLREFGRIMEEKQGLQKQAQLASPEAQQLDKLFAQLPSHQVHGAAWQSAKALAEKLGDMNKSKAISNAEASFDAGEGDWQKFLASPDLARESNPAPADKTAQVAPPAPAPVAPAPARPDRAKVMEYVMNKLKHQKDPKMFAQELANAKKMAGPDAMLQQKLDGIGMAHQKAMEAASEMAKLMQPTMDDMAANPAIPEAPLPPKTQALSARHKVADQKAYDVTPHEDMIGEAHPKPAKVCGDELVENKNEQQDADLAVAQKSAEEAGKKIVTALYKLAKKLHGEGNMEAYKLVADTFLELTDTKNFQ